MDPKTRLDVLRREAARRGGFDPSKPEDRQRRHALFTAKLAAERHARGGVPRTPEGY